MIVDLQNKMIAEFIESQLSLKPNSALAVSRKSKSGHGKQGNFVCIDLHCGIRKDESNLKAHRLSIHISSNARPRVNMKAAKTPLNEANARQVNACECVRGKEKPPNEKNISLATVHVVERNSVF